MVWKLVQWFFSILFLLVSFVNFVVSLVKGNVNSLFVVSLPRIWFFNATFSKYAVDIIPETWR